MGSMRDYCKGLVYLRLISERSLCDNNLVTMTMNLDTLYLIQQEFCYLIIN